MKLSNGFILVPTLFCVCSCNNNKKISIAMNSNTLKITQSVLSDKDYYVGIISLIDPNIKLRIPSKLDEVSIEDKAIDSKNYTYDSESGEFKIGYSIITGPIKITAEASEYHEVFIISSSLSLNKNYVLKNEDCDVKLSVKEPSRSRSVPTKLGSVKVNNVYLDEKDYTYESGRLKIPANKIDGDIVIRAEMYDKKDYSYEVVFDNTSCTTAIYASSDYSKTPTTSTVAYSNDGKGNLLKDGKGQVDFKINVPDNYDIDYIWVKGLYDDIKIKAEDIDEFIYRIDKIRSDLTVTIVTKKASIKDVCYNYDVSTNSFNFSWEQREKGNIDHVNVTMKDNSNNVIDSKNVKDKKYSYSSEYIATDSPYYFSFTPYYKNGTSGTTTTYSKMINEKIKSNTFPRIEINTKNNLEPTNYRIDSLEAASMSQNIKSNIQIFKNNVGVYSSPKKESFGGAKVKIRGNTTAIHYNKKPYKIKLTESEDLLKDFCETKPAINYKNTEWVLISPDFYAKLLTFNMTSEILRFPIGFELAKVLNFSWAPRYTFIEVYLNNDYKGLYMLCESATKGEGNGDSQSRYKIDDDGYLIEKDCYSDFENLSFKSNLSSILVNLDYVFKYPKDSSINEKSIEYINIKKDINAIEKLVLNGSFNELNEKIDFITFAKWLVGQDLMCNEDAYGSNMYLYRKNMNSDSKLKMGTIWDFDASMHSNKKYAQIRKVNFFYIKYFLKMSEFNSVVRSIFNSIKYNCLNDIKIALDERIDNDIFDKQIEVEAKRWNISTIKKMKEQKDMVLDFLKTQLDWLSKKY